MQIGAAYIRVSTDDQLEFSPDAQRKALQDYANKNDIILKNEFIFIDEGISGRKAEKRPEFMKMIATAKQNPKPFDIILVHKFDRFARNREDSVVYKSLLRKECGIKVISITEQIEDDKFSIILESILEAMAEYYSLNLADEVKKGMTEKALRGEYQAYPPLGYTKEAKGKIMTVVPQEAEYIKFIFNSYLRGNSILSIAKQLNAMGVKSKRGNPIENRTIEYILNNPVYIGYSRWTPTEKTRRNYKNPNSIIAKSQHEPIISKEIFQAVQNKLQLQKDRYKHKQRPYEEYRHWLSSLLKCSNCGSSLVRNGDKHFQCGAYSKAKCTVSHFLSVNEAEEAVKAEIKRLINLEKYSELKENLEYHTNNTDEIIFIKKEIELINKKLIRANAAFLSEIDTLEEYSKSKDILLKQKKKLDNKLTNIQYSKFDTEVFRKKLIKVSEILNSDKSNIIKNSSLKEIFNKIIYDKQKHIFYYFIYY